MAPKIGHTPRGWPSPTIPGCPRPPRGHTGANQTTRAGQGMSHPSATMAPMDTTDASAPAPILRWQTGYGSSAYGFDGDERLRAQVVRYDSPDGWVAFMGERLPGVWSDRETAAAVAEAAVDAAGPVRGRGKTGGQ